MIWARQSTQPVASIANSKLTQPHKSIGLGVARCLVEKFLMDAAEPLHLGRRRCTTLDRKSGKARGCFRCLVGSDEQAAVERREGDAPRQARACGQQEISQNAPRAEKVRVMGG